MCGKANIRDTHRSDRWPITDAIKRQPARFNSAPIIIFGDQPTSAGGKPQRGAQVVATDLTGM